MSAEKLEQAIELERNGKNLEAREILELLLVENPQDEKAWLWYADTFPDRVDRIRILDECLQVNPTCQVAQEWLAKNKAEEEAKQEDTDRQGTADS